MSMKKMVVTRSPAIQMLETFYLHFFYIFLIKDEFHEGLFRFDGFHFQSKTWIFTALQFCIGFMLSMLWMLSERREGPLNMARRRGNDVSRRSTILNLDFGEFILPHTKNIVIDSAD